MAPFFGLVPFFGLAPEPMTVPDRLPEMENPCMPGHVSRADSWEEQMAHARAPLPNTWQEQKLYRAVHVFERSGDWAGSQVGGRSGRSEAAAGFVPAAAPGKGWR